ncbi:hypothetical protein, partial [Dickeya lacustris]|uniref:hypothetical protein n=1 Tax=Dickeya lacustris TaxID=2259638 RepID=UPI0022BA3027
TNLVTNRCTAGGQHRGAFTGVRPGSGTLYVAFQPGQHPGQALRTLNRDICTYLCPWREDSVSQGFGSHVALHQIESFIAHLDYVRFVTAFSLVILRQTLRMSATTRPRAGGYLTVLRRRTITPSFPPQTPRI